MYQLSIDIETYSDVDLTKCGVYKYVDSAAFEILLFAYSVDNGEIQIIDLANGEELPEEITVALTSPEVIKTAFNAQFERVCLCGILTLFLIRLSGTAPLSKLRSCRFPRRFSMWERLSAWSGRR